MRSLEFLGKLVSFPTVSRDPNRALIDFVRDVLAARGIASELVLAEDRAKANLLATIGPANVPGVVCPVIPTLCRSTVRTGQAILSGWRYGTAKPMAAARPT